MYSADQLAESVQDILEGKLGNGMVQILTMVDKVDIWNGSIRWRMSRSKAQMMKTQGWVMAPYRFDARQSGEHSIVVFYATDTYSLTTLSSLSGREAIPLQFLEGDPRSVRVRNSVQAVAVMIVA